MHGNACLRDGTFGPATNIGPDASAIMWGARALTMECLLEAQATARASRRKLTSDELSHILR